MNKIVNPFLEGFFQALRLTKALLSVPVVAIALMLMLVASFAHGHPFRVADALSVARAKASHYNS